MNNRIKTAHVRKPPQESLQYSWAEPKNQTHGLPRCSHLFLNRRDIRKLERFQVSLLRIKRQDRITNNEVLIRADMESLEAIITRQRLRWAEHLERMPDSRLPKEIIFSELASGKKPRGAPKRRYKDQLKVTLKKTEIDPAKLGDGSYRKKSLENEYSWKNSSFSEQQKAAWRDEESWEKSKNSKPSEPSYYFMRWLRPTFPCEHFARCEGSQNMESRQQMWDFGIQNPLFEIQDSFWWNLLLDFKPKGTRYKFVTLGVSFLTMWINSWISHDVTAAMLMSPNNEMAVMLVSRSNPPGIESYYYANVFVEKHDCWSREWNPRIVTNPMICRLVPCPPRLEIGNELDLELAIRDPLIHELGSKIRGPPGFL